MLRLPAGAIRAGKGYLTAGISAASGFVLGARLLAEPGAVAYVGYAGHGNVGDDAIIEAEAAALRRFKLLSFRDRMQTRVALTIVRLMRANVRGVLLGGGTLIGRFGWLNRLRGILDVWPDAPVLALGVGVEDPEFPRAELLTSQLELERWAETLSAKFDRVTVRGPRSQQILANVGVEATVVGDPALLLSPRFTQPYEDFRLGINLCLPEAQYGDDPEAILQVMATYARVMVKKGWRIDLIPLWDRDIRYMTRLARLVGAGIDRLVLPNSVRAVRQAVARCHLLVGQRLHAAVLAAACSVPAIALEYRPKCGDFALSIGRADYNIRTDRLSVEQLLFLSEDLASDRERHAFVIKEAVCSLQRKLQAEVERMATTLESSLTR